MTDISHNYFRKDAAKQLLSEIDAYAVATYDGGFRGHLDASIIGGDCTRKTWYSFRWMGRHTFNGRMQRLFQRGHLEEHRYLEYLRGIGATVWDVDPATGKQWHVSKINGHFGGSLDGVVQLPERYQMPIMLVEFKTKNTGSGFQKLKDDGVMLTNSQHFDQMCTYGANYSLEYALYMSTNKNDDDIHIEIIKLSFDRAKDVENKAKYIVAQQTPPPRISDNPTFYRCKGCEFQQVCHYEATPEKNCRSCSYARPIEGGLWHCSGWGAPIPTNVIPVGCPQWTYIRSAPA